MLQTISHLIPHATDEIALNPTCHDLNHVQSNMLRTNNMLLFCGVCCRTVIAYLWQDWHWPCVASLVLHLTSPLHTCLSSAKRRGRMLIANQFIKRCLFEKLIHKLIDPSIDGLITHLINCYSIDKLITTSINSWMNQLIQKFIQ